METLNLKILEKKENLNWEYDDEADVLYISIGEPKPAEGFDIGTGVIARVDPETKELVGLTIIGLSEKILREIKL
jgi:uncharacterized protein YuzE